jgi:hypothetical protein
MTDGLLIFIFKDIGSSGHKRHHTPSSNFWFIQGALKDLEFHGPQLKALPINGGVQV